MALASHRASQSGPGASSWRYAVDVGAPPVEPLQIQGFAAVPKGSWAQARSSQSGCLAGKRGGLGAGVESRPIKLSVSSRWRR